MKRKVFFSKTARLMLREGIKTVKKGDREFTKKYLMVDIIKGDQRISMAFSPKECIRIHRVGMSEVLGSQRNYRDLLVHRFNNALSSFSLGVWTDRDTGQVKGFTVSMVKGDKMVSIALDEDDFELFLALVRKWGLEIANEEE